MHISLDAALQRPPLPSAVGDKLLPTFPGAAAAYSLRALNGDANDVVRVRRSSDDAERDFTAEGVSFELEDWVGAGNDGFVEAWYDQSGNGNHATQDAVDGYQPKIVSAGSLLDGLSFDGVDDELEVSSFITGSNFSAFSLLQCSDISSNENQAWNFTDSSTEYYGLTFNMDAAGNVAFAASTPDSDLGEENYAGNKKLFSTFSGTSNQYFSNGIESLLVKNGRHSPLRGNIIGSQGTSGRHFNGSISEIIIYNSDQSANRTAIESNIADHYGITLS